MPENPPRLLLKTGLYLTTRARILCSPLGDRRITWVFLAGLARLERSLQNRLGSGS